MLRFKAQSEFTPCALCTRNLQQTQCMYIAQFQCTFSSLSSIRWVYRSVQTVLHTVCRSLSMRFWVDDGCMRLTRGSGNVTLLPIFISASARFSLIHIVGELWDWWNWSGNPIHTHRMISLNLVMYLCMEDGLSIWTARRLLERKQWKICRKWTSWVSVSGWRAKW